MFFPLGITGSLGGDIALFVEEIVPDIQVANRRAEYESLDSNDECSDCTHTRGEHYVTSYTAQGEIIGGCDECNCRGFCE